jgi:hypothetical protein
MKIRYTLEDMPLRKQSLCFGDLMRYYGDSKFKLAESIKKIQANKGVAVKLLNAIRNHTKTGMSLDMFLDSLENTSHIDIFKYTVNGKDPCTIFQEETVELEVYMNPVYFSTKGAITQHLPGFRSHKGNVYDQAKKEQDKWLVWFERELNKYHSCREWKKKVIED